MYHFLIDRERVDDFVLLDEDANRVVERVPHRALLLELQAHEGIACTDNGRREPGVSHELSLERGEMFEFGRKHFVRIEIMVHSKRY